MSETPGYIKDFEDSQRVFKRKQMLERALILSFLAAWIGWMIWLTSVGGDVGAIMDKLSNWMIAGVLLLLSLKWIVGFITFIGSGLVFISKKISEN